MAMDFGQKTLYMPGIQKNTVYMPRIQRYGGLMVQPCQGSCSQRMGVYVNGLGPAFCTSMKLWHYSRKSFLPAQASGWVVTMKWPWNCPHWFLSNLDNLGCGSSISTHIIISDQCQLIIVRNIFLSAAQGPWFLDPPMTPMTPMTLVHFGESSALFLFNWEPPFVSWLWSWPLPLMATLASLNYRKAKRKRRFLAVSEMWSCRATGNCRCNIDATIFWWYIQTVQSL